MLQFQLSSLLCFWLTLATARFANEAEFSQEQNGEEGFFKNNGTVAMENLTVHQIVDQPNKLASKMSTKEAPKNSPTTTTPTTDSDFRNVDVILDDDRITVDDGNDDIILDNELPADLLDIIYKKLNMEKLYKSPTINEFGEYLGISNADDIVERLRELITTDDGAAKIKLFMLASDDLVNPSIMWYTQQFETPITNYEYNRQTIVGQIGQCMSMRNNMMAQYKKEERRKQKKEKDMLKMSGGKRQMALEDDISNVVARAVIADVLQSLPRPSAAQPIPSLPISQTLPYNYPVPLRSIDTATMNKQHLQEQQQQQQQRQPLPPALLLLQRFSIMTPKEMQAKLQSKPKLAALAAKIRSIPFSNDNAKLINEPVLAAVTRALREDEDLKKLMT